MGTIAVLALLWIGAGIGAYFCILDEINWKKGK